MSKTKHTSFDAPFHDEKEQVLIEQAEKGNQKPYLSLEQAQEKWTQAVKKTTERKQIALRVQEWDITRIKRLAKQQGIPYQTLISSVIHRVATGEVKT